MAGAGKSLPPIARNEPGFAVDYPDGQTSSPQIFADGRRSKRRD